MEKYIYDCKMMEKFTLGSQLKNKQTNKQTKQRDELLPQVAPFSLSDW